jgi:hypothetical protein
MRGPRVRGRSEGGGKDDDCPGDDGSVNVGPACALSVARLRDNLVPTPGFFRPTLCVDFAVNFSKETARWCRC